MNIGIIGTGGRSLAYLDCIRNMEGCRIAAICDIDAGRLSAYREAHLPELGEGDLHTDYRTLLERPDIDVALICTPDTTHRDIALETAARGKAMLLEKPVATTRADCMDMLDALENFSRPVFLGFVLRYTPFYRKIREIVRSGVLGDVVTLSAREMLDPRHASSFFRRWHRFSIRNGGLMNAKCSHDLDLIQWILGSEPEEVSAMGGNRIFRPKPEAGERCGNCGIRGDCLYAFQTAYYAENFGPFHSLTDLCVYNSEKDIVDHECMMIRYRNGSVAQFELCLFSPEENRTVVIHGTKATLEGDFLRGTVRIRLLGGTETVIDTQGSLGGHGGGDQILLGELFAAAEQGARVNHIRDGCLATLCALAGEESMRSGKTEKVLPDRGAR